MSAHSIRAFPVTRPERAPAGALPRRAGDLARTIAVAWRRLVTGPLHDFVDACLLSGDLRALDGATLVDVGLHREPGPRTPRP